MSGAGGVRAEAGSASTTPLPLVVTLLLACALVLLPALPAAAHARLVDSDPADGERLAAVPAAVRLTFSEDIEPTLAVAAATAPGGTRTQVLPDVAGRDVVVPVSAAADGEYTVAYRVVSEDGHAVSGTVSFTVVGQPPATPTPTPAATSTVTATATFTPTPAATGTAGVMSDPTPAASSTSEGPRAAALAALALLLAAGGAAAVVLLRRRRGAS